MIHIQRFTLVFSVLALTWAPAASAGNEMTEPSALDAAVAVLLDILTPELDGVPGAPGVPPAEAPDAGPQVIFVG